MNIKLEIELFIYLRVKQLLDSMAKMVRPEKNLDIRDGERVIIFNRVV